VDPARDQLNEPKEHRGEHNQEKQDSGDPPRHISSR